MFAWFLLVTFVVQVRFLLCGLCLVQTVASFLIFVFFFFFCLVFFVVSLTIVEIWSRTRTRNSTSRKHSHAMIHIETSCWLVRRVCAGARVFFSGSLKYRDSRVMPQILLTKFIYIRKWISVSMVCCLWCAYSLAFEHVSFIEFPHQFHTFSPLKWRSAFDANASKMEFGKENEHPDHSSVFAQPNSNDACRYLISQFLLFASWFSLQKLFRSAKIQTITLLRSTNEYVLSCSECNWMPAFGQFWWQHAACPLQILVYVIGHIDCILWYSVLFFGRWAMPATSSSFPTSTQQYRPRAIIMNNKRWKIVCDSMKS